MSNKSRHFCILIGLSLTVALGCGAEPPLVPSPPPPPPPPAATFTLSGTIVEATTEGAKPVLGISVEVTSSLRAVTNAEGQYSISRIPFGNHVVRITSFLHETVTRNITIDSDMRLDAEIVRAQMFALSGAVFEVVDGNRVALSGVHVENSNIHDSATTDEDGEFKVLALRGSCHLFVGKPGYVAQNREVSINGDTRIEIQLVRR